MKESAQARRRVALRSGVGGRDFGDTRKRSQTQKKALNRRHVLVSRRSFSDHQPCTLKDSGLEVIAAPAADSSVDEERIEGLEF